MQETPASGTGAAPLPGDVLVPAADTGSSEVPHGDEAAWVPNCPLFLQFVPSPLVIGQGGVHLTPSTSTLEAAAPEVPCLDRLVLSCSGSDHMLLLHLHVHVIS